MRYVTLFCSCLQYGITEFGLIQNATIPSSSQDSDLSHGFQRFESQPSVSLWNTHTNSFSENPGVSFLAKPTYRPPNAESADNGLRKGAKRTPPLPDNSDILSLSPSSQLDALSWAQSSFLPASSPLAGDLREGWSGHMMLAPVVYKDVQTNVPNQRPPEADRTVQQTSSSIPVSVGYDLSIRPSPSWLSPSISSTWRSQASLVDQAFLVFKSFRSMTSAWLLTHDQMPASARTSDVRNSSNAEGSSDIRACPDDHVCTSRVLHSNKLIMSAGWQSNSSPPTEGIRTQPGN